MTNLQIVPQSVEQVSKILPQLVALFHLVIYKRFEGLSNFHAPEFQSNASEFHVILRNLNYGGDGIMDEKGFLKADKGTEKEFLKAQRMIYKMISSNPGITTAEMVANIGVSDRQVRFVCANNKSLTLHMILRMCLIR